ncbi:centrosomal protein of 68 kDa isoform 2-T10 [Menidia menidia]
MATTTRNLTDRHYAIREPLFTTDRHMSILKMKHQQSLMEKEKTMFMSRRKHMKYQTKPEDSLNPESCSLSYGDISTSPSSPLSVSGLNTQSLSKELSLRPSCNGRRCGQRSPASSILQVQTLNLPLRPQLTSKVLNPTCTPRSGHSRPSHSQFSLLKRKDSSWKNPMLNYEGIPSKGDSMSSYQSNYWTCTLPKSLPPSPDRHSLDWNPNKEYQALLDYTYPLRPEYVESEWDSSELLGDSPLRTDPILQDSGIELDKLCSSTSLLGLDSSLSRNVHAQETNGGRNTQSADCKSSDFQSFETSSDGRFSRTPISLTDHGGLFLDSLDGINKISGTNHYQSDGFHCQHHKESSPSSFFHSTKIRPQSEYVCGELDEDFRPLPQKFEVMQQLFRQVKEITVKLSQPGKTSTRSLDSNTTPFLSTINLLRIQGVEEEDTDEIKEPCIDKQDASVGNKEEQKSAGQIGACGISATQRTSFATGLEPSEGGPSQSSVREVENLMQKLCGHTLSDSQSNNRRDQSNSCTLMQNIQIFCSHLELLIQQLYAVSQKIEQLATPTVDIESLKSSLAEYQSFHREVSRHQSVTSCVLHTGYQLLSSINSISPFLRDTLLLIERQSDIRQSSTDHFLSSIMSAMDTLTQTTTPSPVE